MAIDLTQAERKTEFWQISTPKAVGPGSYNAPKTAKPQSQNIVPFNSGETKKLTIQKLT